MELICVSLALGMVWIETRTVGNIINVMSVLCLPYVFVILLNNFIMTGYGFYSISTESLILMTGGMLLFFMGTMFVNFCGGVYESKAVIDLEGILGRYKMRGMLAYVLGVEAIVFCRFCLVLTTHGFAFINTMEYEGLLLSGLLGHLFLTIYPLVPMLFLYWIKHMKKLSYLLAVIFCLALLFLTMVKYHSICMLVLLYLFVSFEDSRYVKIGGGVLVGVAVAFFIGNYIISFVSAGTFAVVNMQFYFTHLWNYISGSLIQDNNAINHVLNPSGDTLARLATCLFALPNMFTRAIFGTSFFPYEPTAPLPVGTNGEAGNVIEIFGFFYPITNDPYEFAAYFLVLIGSGAACALLYNGGLRKLDTNLAIDTAVFLTFFISFSFFGQFFVNPTPWEIWIWSALMPRFFDSRISFVTASSQRKGPLASAQSSARGNF